MTSLEFSSFFESSIAKTGNVDGPVTMKLDGDPMRARDRHRTAREPPAENIGIPEIGDFRRHPRTVSKTGHSLATGQIWDGICPIATALINTKRISDLDLIRELALLGSACDMTRNSGAGQPVAPCAQEFFLQNRLDEDYATASQIV